MLFVFKNEIDLCYLPGQCDYAERFNKKFAENTFYVSKTDYLDYCIVQIFYQP